MGFKTVEEMMNHIKAYESNFHAPIPANFPVHNDYLIGGLTEQAFCDAYRAYQVKMRELYSDMHMRPEDFGLIAYDKKGMSKPAYSMANQYVWLFLALGQAGKIADDTLIIDETLFENFCNGNSSVGKNKTFPKNIDKLLERLAEHGFTIVKKPKNKSFIISTDTLCLMSVIKASTLSPYARLSMTSDYPTFNWRMYKHSIDAKLPFEETYTYSQMNPDMKDFSVQLIKSLADEGWKSYIFFPHSTHEGRLTFPTVEYYYNTSNSTILIRCNGTMATKEFLETLSEKFVEAWKASARCKGCRKECNNRITGEYFGRKGVFCKGDKVRYNDHEVYDIPYIIKSAKYAVGKKL